MLWQNIPTNLPKLEEITFYLVLSIQSRFFPILHSPLTHNLRYSPNKFVWLITCHLFKYRLCKGKTIFIKRLVLGLVCFTKFDWMFIKSFIDFRMPPGMPPPFMPPPGMPMPPGLPRFPALPPGFRLPPPGFIPKTIGDWTEHRLPDGRLYYHNNKSKESKWEKPLEFTESAESNFFFTVIFGGSEVFI